MARPTDTKLNSHFYGFVAFDASTNRSAAICAHVNVFLIDVLRQTDRQSICFKFGRSFDPLKHSDSWKQENARMKIESLKSCVANVRCSHSHGKIERLFIRFLITFSSLYRIFLQFFICFVRLTQRARSRHSHNLKAIWRRRNAMPLSIFRFCVKNKINVDFHLHCALVQWQNEKSTSVSEKCLLHQIINIFSRTRND